MSNVPQRSLPLFLLTIIIIALALSPACSNELNYQLSTSDPPSTILTYHGGALLTKQRTINVFLLWYGAFSPKDRATVNDFFASFDPHQGSSGTRITRQEPTVSTWWKTISSYKDKAGNPVPATVKVVKQLDDAAYSLGKNLKRAQIANYIQSKTTSKALPLDSNGVYFVLTAKDVKVERFCMGSCGFHDSISVVPGMGRVVYSHVGDPSVQCPGLCAWPYAVPAYGPPGPPLVAPNGVGADGMIMNIATVLAGAATNPFKTGYYQGDALAPLEAVTACPGIFGAGAYPGYPGDLKVDKGSKASYNVFGASGGKFLLPAIWDPMSSQCKVIA
ncbi:hypothetical protein EZV62_010353 [Acer yangbiense]|uniref:Uncharacterized protein n=1 Tax=Acer yangbiense TaxID=1000413 RepID=A0A5C7I349_9ROSI|nr:hypothetical protein EZV62_010353 [Acer yangbiense]